MSVPKVMIFFAIIISAILYWATSNVCKYNFALEKRTNILNVVTAEIDPSLGNAKYYIYLKGNFYRQNNKEIYHKVHRK